MTWCEERNKEINQDLNGGGKVEQRKEDAMGGEGEQRIEMKTITMGLSSFQFLANALELSGVCLSLETD